MDGIETEYDAARVYDLFVIQTQGLKGCFNFNYSCEQVRMILEELEN